MHIFRTLDYFEYQHMGFRILIYVMPVSTVNSDESVIMERIYDFTQLLGSESLGEVGRGGSKSPIFHFYSSSWNVMTSL